MDGNEVIDHRSMKIHNLLKILRAVKEHGPVFRGALRELSGLSWATIAASVTELLDARILAQLDKVVTGVGRRPSEIDLNTAANRILGLRMGSTSIMSVFMDIKGRRLSDRRKDIDGDADTEDLLKSLFSVIDDTVQPDGWEKGSVAGIGIAVPGAVDIKNGICLYAPHHPHLKNVPLKRIIEERYRVPCFLDHVNNCAVLGEKWFGLGRTYESFLCILLGTGISSGIMIDGRVYRGVNSASGEFGHISLDANGKQCICGKRGCVEVYASGASIASRAREEAAREPQGGTMARLAGGLDAITCETVFRVAKSGDETARRIFHDMGRDLGLGISTLINLFNPECIILSGKVSRANEFFIDELTRVVNERAWPFSLKKLLVSDLDDSATLGAAAIILEEIFDNGLLLKYEPEAKL